MKTGNILLGTLAGIAIGGLAGILFSPEKGSEIRKNIKDKSDDFVEKLKSKIKKNGAESKFSFNDKQNN